MKKSSIIIKSAFFASLMAVLSYSTGCQVTRERSAEDLASRTANYEIQKLQHNLDNYKITQSNDEKILKEQIDELSKELATAQEQIRYIKQYLIDINNGVQPKDFDNLPATTAEPQLENEKKKAIANPLVKPEELANEKKESLRIKKVNSEEYYVHTVESGETLTSISRQYAIKIKEIKEANRLDNTDRIFVGQKLYIPKK
ncbi:LysM domain-containing protein [Lentisphaerota bacterium WC36G]|nr:LysM peptidoglycan-binding domain-containing protein [Lentisphaerae bacterium WC36]